MMTPQDPSIEGDPGRRTVEPRIAILVLGCLLTVYERCIKTIRATWGSKPVRSVDIFYVYGGQDAHVSLDMIDVEQLIGRPAPRLQDGQVSVSGDIILCGATDVREGQQNCILRKRLIAFGYLANQRAYDFVYTVCASSYVDVDGLKRYVGDLPSTGVYHGPLHVDGHSGYPFVSGASLLLSGDIAAELADGAAAILSAYPESMPDDVVMGHVIASKHCRESSAEIARRIGAGERAADNQTFVAPCGGGTIDFVTAPEYTQIPNGQSYHFHFNSRRVWEMENFHRRFFAGLMY